MQDNTNTEHILSEALPYIKRIKGKIIVIKYGGSLMSNDAIKPLFAQDIVLLKHLGINPIIVHGGGKEISKWMHKIGKESVFIEGLRVTDNDTMELTEMVLSGKINSEVVSMINSAGGNAVGLSGKDAQLFKSKKRHSKNNQDLGLVGDIIHSDVSLLSILSEKGYIPVISSVSYDDDGNTLNVNADHVAQEIATALKALKLILLTDVQGLLIDGQCCSKLSLSEAKKLLSHPDVHGGMLPKLESVIQSIQGGVSDVHMINGNIEHALLLELLTETGIGTMIFQKSEKEAQ